MATENRRMMSAAEGDVVVFLIGMRVNRWWKPWQWLRTALAMPRMLRELSQHPELGFLSAESYFGRTTLLLSYWRSMDDLLAYAKLRGAEHLPAWRAFNQFVGMGGDVGIWHESYRVHAGDYETVYLNMPAFGLAKAAGSREALGHRISAAGRLGVPVPADSAS